MSSRLGRFSKANFQSKAFLDFHIVIDKNGLESIRVLLDFL